MCCRCFYCAVTVTGILINWALSVRSIYCMTQPRVGCQPPCNRKITMLEWKLQQNLQHLVKIGISHTHCSCCEFCSSCLECHVGRRWAAAQEQEKQGKPKVDSFIVSPSDNQCHRPETEYWMVKCLLSLSDLKSFIVTLCACGCISLIKTDCRCLEAIYLVLLISIAAFGGNTKNSSWR